MTKHNRWFLTIFLLISFLLACRLGPSRPQETPSSQPQAATPAPSREEAPPQPQEEAPPQPPPTPTPPSDEIAPDGQTSQRAKPDSNQALQESSGQHPFQFRLTDQEATSLMTTELAQQAGLPLSEPQIRFSSGQIHISGNLEGIGASSFPALIVATPFINSNGQLEIRIDQAQMGNFKLPKAIVDSLSQTANESLAEMPTDIQIQHIEILEGELVVTGTRRSP